MGFDKETADLMAEVNASQVPLGALPVQATRLAARSRRSVDGPPEEVAKVVDRSIPGPAGDLRVRIYYPSTATGPLPGSLFFHGGGWTLCDLETHDPTCRRLANASGSVIVSVDYRLAPENPFPAAVDDALAATKWVLRHGASIEIDPSRVAVMGDSAGANLSTVTALLLRGRKDLPALRAQVLIVPVTEYLPDNSSYRQNAEGCYLTKMVMEWFFSHYLTSEDDRQDWRAFPSLAPSVAGLPPALVITAEFDPLRDEGEAYARKLRDAGVETEVERYPGTIHQFVIFAGRLPQGRRATDRIGEFLRRQLAAR